MTQEDKDIMLKDLCARLPYNVVVRCTDSDTDYKCFLTTDILHEIQNGYEYYDYKPYLRPMSGMTEEEKEKLKEEHKKDERIYIEVIERIANGDEHARGTAVPHFAVDWCNEHHFDYRGLIEKGLALEAPEGMYKEDKK